MRRTKIVTTLGPASIKSDVLREMIIAGANVVRLNFSHGEPADHIKTASLVRTIAKELGQIVGIMVDLQGPKIRISKFKKSKINLVEGAEFILDADLAKDAGDERMVGIDYKELPQDVVAGDVLLLDDGRLVLKVASVKGAQIFCRVVVGGELSNNKGINRQGGGLSAPALTDKDKEDIKIAAQLQADYIAVSFPRVAADLEEARNLMQAAGWKAGVIAKIERLEAVATDTLDALINASDGIMVARGDLAVEIGDAEVPAAQKYMVQRARDLNKPVITATQMMESMIHNAVPTRAEVSDVANAVLDGSDAVMLSAETAVGDYPVLVVKTMDRVCQASEKNQETLATAYRADARFTRIDEAIAKATVYTANHINIKAIIALTESGVNPLWMSRIRSGIPIYGLCRHQNILGKMALYSDVYPINFDVTNYTTAEVKSAAIATLKAKGLVNSGDRIIVTYGDNVGMHGGTNSMTILEVV